MAKKFDIVVDKGADFEMELQVLDKNGLPFDVTGWTYQGSVRATYDSAVIETFTVDVVNATNGDIEIKMPALKTDKLTPAKNLYGPATAVYDIIMTDGTEIKRILHGKVQVNPRVT